MKEKTIELNSNNMLFNLDFYKKNTCKDIIAIIKDNAYGHGVKQAIEILGEETIKLACCTDY